MPWRNSRASNGRRCAGIDDYSVRRADSRRERLDPRLVGEFVVTSYRAGAPGGPAAIHGPPEVRRLEAQVGGVLAVVRTQARGGHRGAQHVLAPAILAVQPQLHPRCSRPRPRPPFRDHLEHCVHNLPRRRSLDACPAGRATGNRRLVHPFSPCVVAFSERPVCPPGDHRHRHNDTSLVEPVIAFDDLPPSNRRWRRLR